MLLVDASERDGVVAPAADELCSEVPSVGIPVMTSVLLVVGVVVMPATGAVVAGTTVELPSPSSNAGAVVSPSSSSAVAADSVVMPSTDAAVVANSDVKGPPGTAAVVASEGSDTSAVVS